MDLIKIGTYTPPSPTKYDVSFNDFNGAEEDLENGGKYIEQIVAQKPSISLAWEKLPEADVVKLMASVKPALFTCTYFFGESKTCTAYCDEPKISLSIIKGNERYYDVSLTLEG